MAQVWQEVLHTPVRGPEDDFFDAGGDSLKAIAFMMELERALGLELSLTLITRRRDSPALRGPEGRRTPRYVPLVPLKPGEDLPPVFFIHGLGGNVAAILPMARRMTYPGAVIGIQARGLTRGEPPHASVEAMAADYLNEIKARQPSGPYYLCGYSFGGLVAFEMARRLRERETKVGPGRPFRHDDEPAEMAVAFLALHHRPAHWASAQGGCGHVDAPAGSPLPGVLKASPASIIKVAASALIASARYRPGFYPGELTLFTPVGREPGLPSLQAIWRKHARTLSVVETAGDHSTMLSPLNAESTAASLTRCFSQC